MNIFNTIELPKVGSNMFDMSHTHTTSFRMGEIIPFCVMETLPGDKWKISHENWLRFAPLISPVMHFIQVKCNWFFCPYRLIWVEWEDFITNEVDVEMPYLTGLNSLPLGSLQDYLGVSPEVTLNTLQISAFQVAVYTKIWDEYYRDQNLQIERFSMLVPGNNNTTGTTPYTYDEINHARPMLRAYNGDAYTRALPFAQKGDEVTIPLVNGGNVPVTLVPGSTNTGKFVDNVNQNPAGPGDVQAGAATDNLTIGGATGQYDPNDTLQAEIDDNSVTVRLFRQVIKLQEWLERNARGGTRYFENIWAHFGKKSPDSRLQRPEYLGGCTQAMVISEVLSTAQTIDQSSNDIPIGALRGHGISAGSMKPIRYTCDEHGLIMGMITVTPVHALIHALHPMYLRNDNLDYAWPTFAHIGEQEIKNAEVDIEHLSSDTEASAAFGYGPRYYDWKQIPSRVSSEMRTTLKFWHLARDFTDTPVLDGSFIEVNPSESSRIFAIETGADQIQAQIMINASVIRKLPKFGIPSFV